MKAPPFPAQLTDLPQLVRRAGERNVDASAVREFARIFLAAQSGMFTGALLFASRDGHAFLKFDSVGDPRGEPRSWMRWPLGRLFSAGRACVITATSDGSRALAVPFLAEFEQRYVAIFTIDPQKDCTPADALLVRTFEALSLAKTAPDVYAEWAAHADAISFSGVPRLVWFGSRNDRYLIARDVLLRRGWGLPWTEMIAALCEALNREAVDVVLFDVPEDRPRLQTVRAISTILRTTEASIVLLDSGEDDAELDVLVERRIPRSTDSDSLFQAVKDIVRRGPGRRRESLVSLVSRARRRMLESPTCTALAQSLAAAVDETGAEWAAVHLVDAAGNLYAAQWPGELAGDELSIPSTFLSGCTILRSRVDDAFLEEITDDPRMLARYRALHPLSGAALPIVQAGRVVGSLLAFTTTWQMGDDAFSALQSLSECASQAFDLVQVRMRRARICGSPRRANWISLDLARCRIDAYNGPAGSAAIRTTELCDGSAALVAVAAENAGSSQAIAEWALSRVATLGSDVDTEELDSLVEMVQPDANRVLAGIINTEAAFTYATAAYPEPVQIASRGPLAPFSYGRLRSSGSIMIRPRTVTLLCDGPRPNVDYARVVQAVHQDLRAGIENPLRGIVKYFNDPDIAIAAITIPNFGAEQ